MFEFPPALEPKLRNARGTKLVGSTIMSTSDFGMRAIAQRSVRPIISRDMERRFVSGQ